MDSTTLAGLAGILLSLSFSYIPKIKPWYDARDGVEKRAIMALSVVVVAAGVYGVSCLGWAELVTCDKAGALGLVKTVLGCLVANQATFLLTPKNSVS